MGAIMGSMFNKLAKTEHGTVHFIKDNVEDHIDAYWGSKESWEKIPDNYNDLEHFTDWDKVIKLDHGYDETKPEDNNNFTKLMVVNEEIKTLPFSNVWEEYLNRCNKPVDFYGIIEKYENEVLKCRN